MLIYFVHMVLTLPKASVEAVQCRGLTGDVMLCLAAMLELLSSWKQHVSKCTTNHLNIQSREDGILQKQSRAATNHYYQ